MAEQIKKCSICKSMKQFSEFHKDSSTSSGYKTACKTCNNIKRKARYHENSYDKQYRENTENREWHKKYLIEYRKNNYEKVRSVISEWSLKNKDKCLAKVLRYKYKKMNATAKWDAEFTEFITQEATHLAKLRKEITGFKWDVDHIYPLQGKEVCGLHVWNNLQVIPSEINKSKGNKFNENLTKGLFYEHSIS
ncbi:hypothetical protein UFOVP146_44 [uncultured Caudovirales phage]|uniref:HNHc domain containing protein n=1 Tax=uncultured Caudovirales phage TaxID=2100421 RepID=A0A6J7VM31_9CAUD|nr:hypothetical protein UFOVP146_44 [uncultured Caudovirales phage]